MQRSTRLARQLDEEGVLALEVLVERRPGGVGDGGDVLDRSPVEAVLRETGAGRFHDLLASSYTRVPTLGLLAP